LKLQQKGRYSKHHGRGLLAVAKTTQAERARVVPSVLIPPDSQIAGVSTGNDGFGSIFLKCATGEKEN